MNPRRTIRKWKVAVIKKEVEDETAWKIAWRVYFLTAFLLIIGYFLGGYPLGWHVRWAGITLLSTFLFIVLTNSINVLTGNIKFPADWGRK